MDRLVIKALETINRRIAAMSGVSHPSLSHPDDRDAVTELFARMDAHGIPLSQEEIENWARNNGWPYQEAEELGELASKADAAENRPDGDAPFWNENIVEILELRNSAAARPQQLAKEACNYCPMQCSNDNGFVECLMEVMSRRWVESLGAMACCNYLGAAQLIELSNFPQIIPI